MADIRLIICRFCVTFSGCIEANFMRIFMEISTPPPLPPPPKPPPKWPPATPYARKSLRSLPYGASWLPQSSKSTPYAYLSRRLCFKIVEIPSLRGHSKFLHAQNILQDRLLNFRHPKIFDMRHELNLRRTKIFDMGYEKFQGSTYRTFRTSVML